MAKASFQLVFLIYCVWFLFRRYRQHRVSGTTFSVATHDEIHRQYVQMDNDTSAFAHSHALVLAPIYGNLSHPEKSAVVV